MEQFHTTASVAAHWWKQARVIEGILPDTFKHRQLEVGQKLTSPNGKALYRYACFIRFAVKRRLVFGQDHIEKFVC